MKWETFPHDADIGVRGLGATPAEAFAGAAMALASVICDPRRVAATTAATIDCSAPDDELLLLDWLNALVYEMATRHLLFARFDVDIRGRHLHAVGWGEAVDPQRHQPAAEIKAASACELSVAQRPDGQWLAQCVVDV
jgi:SHS2 domain-containing protein